MRSESSRSGATVSPERILVATWGNPWRDEGIRWGEVDYKFDGRSERSRTSLTPLLRVIKPDRVVVFGLDTVATRGTYYSEVIESARDRYVEAAGAMGVDRALGDLGFEPEDVFSIAPGVGTFRNGRFEGRVEDFYFHVLRELSAAVAPADAPLELHLDLTHGINYMPVMTYRAVKELAGIAAASREVRLLVYNSDPYPQAPGSGGGVPKLRINVVESGPVPWEPCRELIGDKAALILPLDLNSDERGEIYRRDLGECRDLIRRERKRLNAFSGAIVNGLPLALLSFHPGEAEELWGCVDRVIDVVRELTDVTQSEGRILLRRRAGVGPALPTLVKILFSAKILADLQGGVTLDVLEEVREIDLEGAATLNMLEEVRKRIFRKNRRLDVMIGRDLKEIRDLLESKRREGFFPLDWVRLGELLEGEVGGYSDRNFLAHSGLERNSVEVLTVEGRPLLRYARDMLPRVLEDSASGLVDRTPSGR